MTSKHFNQILITLVVFALALATAHAQDVYKTPYGEKYHLANCRMVENVSKKLLNDADIAQHGLKPCKICKPPIRSAMVSNYSSGNKAAGESNSVQCKGTTKAGTRCLHKTTIANGFCYQHGGTAQLEPAPIKVIAKSPASGVCGARTKSGGACQRKVSNGGRCYQH